MGPTPKGGGHILSAASSLGPSVRRAFAGSRDLDGAIGDLSS